MGVIISNLTFSKINQIPLTINVENDEYPIAPLVFAQGITAQKVYKLQIVVYVPSNVINTPILRVLNDGKPVALTIPQDQNILARNFIVEYDLSETEIPKEYNAWNINVEYYLKNLKPVNYILTHLQDIDPKTSRGTVTTVQET
ncbi:hypothetical protein SY27_07045 [Flavobacterium sp. 316]|uniref:hypothetical protein n=1 Tax=Flavobacterium sp. 316 TaxID=1603293 RepID=UPI0005E09E6E|nr:hypothetical protein [Flavobacterium sp. 316]KIX21460.1 hypothetical protein SY27_07045 [Flavobacterium sp. 316]